MPSTIDCSFGDIVLVPFPFTDQTTTKQRPAVVISSDNYHRQRPDVIVMAVTSQLRSAAAGQGDVLVDGWQAAGLLKPSAIKPVIATIDRALLRRTLGALVPSDAERLRRAITQILG